MKVHICYDFVDGPWGGGNQFLKAVREQLRLMGVYAEQFEDADAYLINAFPTNNMQHFLRPILAKISLNKKIFYRLDGLYYRNREDDHQKYIDEICTFFANNFCDGIIYQTNWIKDIQIEFGISKDIPHTTILNAPNNSIFNTENKKSVKSSKIRLVSTCWAPSSRKGFKYYQFLDENLDFSKYHMTFIGNSPIEFKNIETLPPLPSVELAEKLKTFDGFISCAYDEPCSNSLIEAIHSGLTPVGHNSGGTPDIINNSKHLFNSSTDLIETIEYAISFNYRSDLPSIKNVAQSYYNFMCNSSGSNQNNLRRKSREFTRLLSKKKLMDSRYRKVEKKIKGAIKKILG